MTAGPTPPVPRRRRRGSGGVVARARPLGAPPGGARGGAGHHRPGAPSRGAPPHHPHLPRLGGAGRARRLATGGALLRARLRLVRRPLLDAPHPALAALDPAREGGAAGGRRRDPARRSGPGESYAPAARPRDGEGGAPGRSVVAVGLAPVFFVVELLPGVGHWLTRLAGRGLGLVLGGARRAGDPGRAAARAARAGRAPVVRAGAPAPGRAVAVASPPRAGGALRGLARPSLAPPGHVHGTSRLGVGRLRRWHRWPSSPSRSWAIFFRAVAITAATALVVRDEPPVR